MVFEQQLLRNDICEVIIEEQYQCQSQQQVVVVVSANRMSIRSQKETVLKNIQMENIKKIKTTCSFTDLFPDSIQELGNHHSALIATLDDDFHQLYEDMAPSHIVFVRGVADVLDLGPSAHFSFSVENGVSLLLTRTYPQEHTFINGNIFQQQLIYDSQGNHCEGMSSLTPLLTQLIASSRKGLQPDFYFGAIITLHSNIPQNSLHYHEIVCLALYIALLIIHQRDVDNQYILQEIIRIAPHLDRTTFQNILFHHQYNKFYITCQDKNTLVDCSFALKNTIKSLTSYKMLSHQNTKESMRSFIQNGHQKENQGENFRENFLVSLDYIGDQESNKESMVQITQKIDFKIVFCKLELGPGEIEQYQYKVNVMKNLKKAVTDKYIKFNEEYKLLHCNENEKAFQNQQFKQLLSVQQICYINYENSNKALLNLLQSNIIRLPQYLTKKWKLDKEYDVYSQQVTNLMQMLKKECKHLKVINNEMQNSVLIEGNFIVAAVSKVNYTDAIYSLRKLFSANKLSTSGSICANIRSKPSHDIIFAATPSEGAMIYQPKCI